MTDWRSHCCWHESFVDNHNNKINQTRSRSRSRNRRRREEMETKRKRTIQLIHHRLKSFKRASLFVSLLVLRFPLTPHLPPKIRAICRWIELSEVSVGTRKRGCEWVDKCLYDIRTSAYWRTNERNVSLMHTSKLALFNILVQLCAPFSVYFNSYSWRFLHDHNIEKPQRRERDARKYRFRIVILWTDRQWFWIKASKRKTESERASK